MIVTARQFWNEAYNRVLVEGSYCSPRERKTLELRNTKFVIEPHQHLDPRQGRNISLDYIRREFLWYMLADGRDTRITKYAPVWKTCIDSTGNINSNYGQYLFTDVKFLKALDWLVSDPDSRRCWIPIMQSSHITNLQSKDIPCHTGFGFRIINSKLEMSVHHRSLDMWHGAANDFPIAFLWQLMAQAYLKSCNVFCDLGPITHIVESAHFYERHIELAQSTVYYEQRISPDVLNASTLMQTGFTEADLYVLLRVIDQKASPLLDWIFDIDGDYGRDDPLWRKYYGR